MLDGFELTKSKLFSLAVVGFYLVAYVVNSGGVNVGLAYVCGYLTIPLALIWFPDYFGDFTGYVGRGASIDSETPAVIISGFGWLILIGVPAWAYFYGQ